ANPAETSERLIAAAAQTGIEICIIPVFYQTGGFGKDALPEQRRFVFKDTDEYLKLVDGVSEACKQYPGAHLGLGIHSLRAAKKDAVKTILADHSSRPLHIHVSEQRREVEECQRFYGKRPIAWLAEQGLLSKRLSL